ncbi:hypothetical protein ACIOEX_01555 [Streptomyces sp. NPDC087850]|uniref:hypothetical protein n=1 Tax=Streptomyces sp. NPDC087850 TaxID=3365809 RepID=UPI00382F5DBA
MTTTQTSRMVTTAVATRQGAQDHRRDKAFNCDSSAIYSYPVADLTAVAVVDGIGDSAEVAEVAQLAARVAVRVGARKGRVAGLLAAAELYADPGAIVVEPDAVAIVALAEPGEETCVAWVGDCRAWGWDGDRLRQYSTDHTLGEHLRHLGADPVVTRLRDHWVRVTLGRAVVATVCQAEIPEPLVILTSDGVHDALDETTIAGLVHAYPDDPGALAEALVAAVRSDPTTGYRDDATALVMLHHR